MIRFISHFLGLRVNRLIIKSGGAGVLLLWAGGAMAEEPGTPSGPWEKASISAGLFYSRVESGIRMGIGQRFGLDAENLLGLSPEETVFRVEGSWRFSDNRRHRLDLMWFSFRRSGQGDALEDFTIEDADGNPIDIIEGTTFDSYLDIDIYEGAYSYSFIQDDRIDLAVRGGLYVMPIGMGIKVEGLFAREATREFTAPLPVLGYRMDLALTPRWYIRTGTQVFYFEYSGFKGSLLQGQAAVEYAPWKNAAVGLGFDTLNFDLESDGTDINGSVDFAYTGLQLYLRAFFD